MPSSNQRRPPGLLARLFSVLLVAVLVCAQQAAVVHSLVHWVGHFNGHADGYAVGHEVGHAVGHSDGHASGNAPLSAAPALDPDTKDTDAYCDKCFQFAHVAGIALGYLGAMALPAGAVELAQAPPVAALAAAVPGARSRGPPPTL